MKTSGINMKNNSIVRIVLLMGVIVSFPGLFCQSAGASFIFSQLPVDGAPAFTSDFTNGQQIADNFEIYVPAALSVIQVTKIRWWGSYIEENIEDDNFVLRFFGDAGGAPLTAPFAEYLPLNLTRTATSLIDDWDRTVFKYEADLASALSLNTSTIYYFSPVNNTTSGVWKWAGDGVGGDSHWYRTIEGNTWTTSGADNDMAFELIPETATVILLGLGSLVIFRRRS